MLRDIFCWNYIIILMVIGWDISSMDLGHAMERAQVFDCSLQEQLQPYMSRMKPRPSIYIPEFIAANQESRADNVLTGTIAEQVCLGTLIVKLNSHVMIMCFLIKCSCR